MDYYSRRVPLYIFSLFTVLTSALSCSEAVEHTAEAVSSQDSLPFMHSVGVSTLISDSGVIRYHLVAEEWDIYMPDNSQATWKFYKGLLMTRLDDKFHVDLHVQADTAFLHEQRLWELRGRVKVRNVEGTVFLTEQLWWDLNKHEMWNHTDMTIISPERTLRGTEFRSNEQMTRYSVANSVGDFPVSDTDEAEPETSANGTPPDTASSEPVFSPMAPAPDKRQFVKTK